MTDDPEITDPRDPMKRPDIVTELDRWLENEQEWMRIDSKWQHLIAKEVVERARDELVGLRAVLDIQKRLPDKIAVAVHDAALEDAAAACLRKARDHVIPIGQDNYHDGCVSCAEFIRLKLRDHD